MTSWTNQNALIHLNHCNCYRKVEVVWKETCMFIEYLWKVASCRNYLKNANLSGSADCDASLQGHVLLLSLICPFYLAHYEELKLLDLLVWSKPTGMSDMVYLMLFWEKKEELFWEKKEEHIKEEACSHVKVRLIRMHEINRADLKTHTISN